METNDASLLGFVRNNDLKGLVSAITSTEPTLSKNMFHKMICCAIFNDNMDIFDYLLELNLVDLNEGINCTRDSLLMYIARWTSDEKYFLKLIKKGADINFRNHNGDTLLHMLVGYSNSLAIGKTILETGADVNAVNNEEHTPLFLACEHNDEDWVHMLLYYGAVATTIDLEGKLPLTICSESPQLEALLFDHTFNDNVEKVELPALVYSMVRGSSLVETASEVIYDEEGLFILDRELPNLVPGKFRIFVKKFSHVVEDYFACYSPLQRIVESIGHFRREWRGTSAAKEILLIFLESDFCTEFVQSFKPVFPVIGCLVKEAHRNSVELEEVAQIVCLLLSHGLTATTYDLDVVYECFGLCELFRILLQMELHEFCNEEFEKLGLTSTMYTMAVLYYDLNTDLDILLDKVPPTLTLLSFFNNPTVQRRYLTADNNFKDEIVDRIKSLPAVTSLIELSRNAARKFIIDRFKIKSTMNFYTILNWLPVDKFTGGILSLQRKLYYLH